MQSDKNCYAVILAGGSGTRFWPKSRQKQPKQLCRLAGSEHTMIEETLNRLDGFIDKENRIIVTHQTQVEKTKNIIGDKAKYILAEPESKNTAAALTLAACFIEKLCPENPVMISLHADHIIPDKNLFWKSLAEGIETARRGFLTLIGITPTKPETGYGYIERGRSISFDNKACHVNSFREKPDRETASHYIKTGKFFWNSGIFIWQTNTLLEEVKDYLPKTYNLLSKSLIDSHLETLQTPAFRHTYHELDNIAIDHAVLEKSKRVAMISGPFSWQDVGSWTALEEVTAPDNQGNLLFGPGLLLESKNTTIDTDGLFVATLGVEDLVIVVHQGAVLVTKKDHAQDVKKIVQKLKEKGREDLL